MVMEIGMGQSGWPLTFYLAVGKKTLRPFEWTKTVTANSNKLIPGHVQNLNGPDFTEHSIVGLW